MNSIEKLAEIFEKFPGVGKRQAKRFVYYLLRKNQNFARDLSTAVSRLKDNIHICQESFQYFYSDDSSVKLSPIARDPNRDRSLLLVVEKDRNRQGFPLEVLEEIFLLQEIHEKKFPATRSSIDKR